MSMNGNNSNAFTQSLLAVLNPMEERIMGTLDTLNKNFCMLDSRVSKLEQLIAESVNNVDNLGVVQLNVSFEQVQKLFFTEEYFMDRIKEQINLKAIFMTIKYVSIIITID